MGTTQLNFKSIITALAGAKSACIKNLKTFQTRSKEMMLLLSLIKILISLPPPCLALSVKRLIFSCCEICQNNRVL